MKYFFWGCFCAFFLSIGSLLIFTHVKNKTTQRTNFIVGMASGYAPFVSINSLGQYEGFDIDIAQQIANRMNTELVLQDMGSLPSLFLALEQGTIDAIIWGLSITSTRLKSVHMVPYKGEKTIAYPLIFFKKNLQKINSFQDLEGLTVCVEAGSCQQEVLNTYPKIHKKTVSTVTQAVLEIQYQKADAALVEPAIAKQISEKLPDMNMINLPLKEEHQILGIGIAIKKENANLIKKIEAIVQELKQEELITLFSTKWGLP